MHELATTRSIVSICEKAAAQQGAARVLEIRLKVGELSGIVPECLQDFFPYVAKDTVCQGAKLVCESVPVSVSCPECGYDGPARGWDCPCCGAGSLRITGGREFFVENIAVE